MSNAGDYETMLNDGSGIQGDWTLYIRDRKSNVSIFNVSTYVRYKNLGDSLEVVAVNPTGYLYQDRVRSGDMVTLNFIKYVGAAGTIVGTTETSVLYVGGDASTAKIVLAATASAANYSALFTAQQNGYKQMYCNFYSKSNPSPEKYLVDWEIQFLNGSEVGAQIGYKIEDGIETGLRAVSVFKNADWKSGIWSNGIFEDGLFEGGIWYNGIFRGTWG